MPGSERKSARAPGSPPPGDPTDGHQRELLRPDDVPGLLEAAPSRIEVEIGCGNGHFLAEYCRAHPSVLFIGVEIKKKRCLKAQRRIDKGRLSNARVIHGAAEQVLEHLPELSIDNFHLYFPDPWPKSRHRRRRFLRRDKIDTLYRKLKIGGAIFFVTDYFDYYLHTKVLFLLHPGLQLSPLRPNESVFQSVFAQRFADSGKPIRSLTARRSAGPPAAGSSG